MELFILCSLVLAIIAFTSMIAKPPIETPSNTPEKNSGEMPLHHSASRPGGKAHKQRDKRRESIPML